MGFYYEILKKKYERLYNKTIEDNKEILIESFVEYYGEKHRDEIVSRFNEIIFIYYINWERFLKVLNFIDLRKEENIIFKDVNDFFEYRTKKDDNFKDSFVGTSNKKLLKNILIASAVKEKFIETFSNGDPLYLGVMEDKSKMDRLIFLPIVTHNKTTIIHEINHALTDFPLLLDDLKNKFESKMGIQMNDDEEFFHELINERASLEIYEIFKRRGGNLTHLYFSNHFNSYYTYNTYLIDEFYNKFKRIIKESYITLNKNNLIERIGKDNYQELVDMVNKYYNKDLTLSRKNKKETKEVRKRLVRRMQKKVINTEDLTKEDLEKFYKELEQVGKKVTILNELPEKNEENNSLHF